MVRKLSLLVIVVVINICIISNVLALNLEYKDYIVQKGDTLWDISSAELKDPFLWPNIWKENPDISNPDLIYPDQHVRIPIYMLQKQVRLTPPPTTETPPSDVSLTKEITETVPEGMEKAPAKEKPKAYLTDKNLIMLAGYISPDIPGVGIIKQMPTGRKLAGQDDEVYVTIEKGDTTPGRMFYTFRPPIEWRKVKHPKGGMVGYLIEITGIAELVGEETGNMKAVIKKSFVDVNADKTFGDRLMDYYEIEPPLETDSPRMPDIRGTIVMTRDLRELNAEGDVLYLDKGSEDGVIIGDVFKIISNAFPRIELGQMVIILTKEKTSTALVTFSKNPIEIGDTF